FNNDAGYISDYVVTNDDLSGLNNSYLNNDAGYLTSYTETDPIWISEKSNYYNKTEADDNFVDVSGDTMTGDLNMSNNNVTNVDCITFNSGGQICSVS
ncbi:MAG: hypothetical protein ACOCZ5_02225, partial [bacterium]